MHAFRSPVVRRTAALAYGATVFVGSACAPSVIARADGGGLVEEARTFMSGYADDLRAGNRAGIAARYHRSGAYFLGNGSKTLEPYDSIVSRYRGSRWSPPASFEWRDLSFEAIGPDEVVVAGRFLWGPAAGQAPLTLSYTGVLRRQDGQLRIRLEDESLDPSTLPVVRAARETASKPLSPRFNHVFLSVTNLDSSITFYTTAFDLRVTQRITELRVTGPDGVTNARAVKMALLKFPGQEFVLELAERPATAAAPSGAAPFYQHVGVDVRDIDATAERVRSAGGRNLSPVQTVMPSTGSVVKNMFFRGPSGELVELMQMVSGEF